MYSTYSLLAFSIDFNFCTCNQPLLSFGYHLLNGHCARELQNMESCILPWHLALCIMILWLSWYMLLLKEKEYCTGQFVRPFSGICCIETEAHLTLFHSHSFTSKYHFKRPFFSVSAHLCTTTLDSWWNVICWRIGKTAQCLTFSWGLRLKGCVDLTD